MANAIVFAIAGRFLLSLTSLNEVLLSNHLLASPLTSFSRLREGVFLNKNGVDPYSGGGFYHSPLLLSLFSTVLPPSPILSRLIWAVCDATSAYLLASIWRFRSSSGNGRVLLVLGSLLLNPYTFLPSLAFSTSTLEQLLFLASIYFACTTNTFLSLYCLAISTYLSLTNVFFVPPIIMLLQTGPRSKLSSPNPVHYGFRKSAVMLAKYVVWMTYLAVTCTIYSGGFHWVKRTWGTGVLLPDLTPNPGLWWYFFTEMFDHFRPFFLMVFSMHLVIYVAPVCIKFSHDPLYAIFILQGIISIFKSYPTMADSGLFISMISIFPEIYGCLRHPIVTALLHLHASLLLPLFHNLWLSQGTGNANFFYASTLVFGMANGAAVIDCIWAGLRVAFPEKNGFDIAQE